MLSKHLQQLSSKNTSKIVRQALEQQKKNNPPVSGSKAFAAKAREVSMETTTKAVLGETDEPKGSQVQEMTDESPVMTKPADGVKKALTQVPDTVLEPGSVGVDILSAGVSVARDYALQMLWSEASVESSVKQAISVLLTYSITSIKSLSPWVSIIVKAVDMLASIPKGVVSTVLWAIGKMWLWAANKLYNGGWIAAWRGDVTESSIFGILGGFETAHSKLHDFVKALKEWVDSIQESLTKKLMGFWGGGSEETPEDATTDAETLPSSQTDYEPNLVSNQFISLGINPPKLGQWDGAKAGEKRAGLQASGRAQVSLIGQSLGGNVDINLPFGTGWEIAVEPVFQSSSIRFGDFISAKNVQGDKLVINEDGLDFFGASINGLSIASGRVKSEKIGLNYAKGQQEVNFYGDAQVPLWDDKKLDGNFDLTLDTAGKFKSGRAKVSSSDSFQVIPEYMSIVNPSGEVQVKEDASPEFEISTDVNLENLPGGVHANVSQAKVFYHDKALGGEIASADVTIPIGPHTTMTLAMTQAKFTKERIEAKNAFMDLEHDSSKALNEEAIVGSSLFTESNILSSIFDLKQLSVHQGLSSLKYEGGKFTYEKDPDNGLKKLRARVLGLDAYYDVDKNKGSIEGEWSQKASIPVVDIDIPLVAGVAGGSIGLKGGFEVGAGVGLDITQNKPKENETLYDVEGKVKAHAKAFVRVEGGAFFGIPYLAKLQGGLHGEVDGSIFGDVSISGGLKYTKGKEDHAFGSFGLNPAKPIEGKFNLGGKISANVGASVKAKALFFEKQIASITLGEWTLGEYNLMGSVTKDETGRGYRVQIDHGKSGFKKTEKEPSKTKPLTTPVDKWINQHVKEKNTIKYDDKSQAERRIAEVSRKTLFSSFSSEESDELIDKYDNLLSQTKQKDMLANIYTNMKAKKNKLPDTGSFIWSVATWNEAVKRAWWSFFDNKAKVADSIEKYHTDKTLKTKDRRAMLDEMESLVIKYKDKESKTEENIASAEEFLNNIQQERFFAL